jgi:DNA-directed RNA polymerase subunit N (RpoN/RPB10)
MNKYIFGSIGFILVLYFTNTVVTSFNKYLLIIVGIGICLLLSYVKEGFVSDWGFMSRPSKCFSCEKDIIRRMGPEYAWMAQPTKCFSCESQIYNNYKNPALGVLGGPTRCPSCALDAEKAFGCNKCKK